MRQGVSLSMLVESIVDIVNEAVRREVKLTAEQVHAALLELHPGIPDSLVELAFDRASGRLSEEAERNRAEADALRAELARRQAVRK